MNELITIENNKAVLAAEASERLAEFERQIKRIKEDEEKLKRSILEAMEQYNVVQMDTKDVKISYVAPALRESVDIKQLTLDYPEIVDKYRKFSNVSSSVRIKVKE